MPIIYNAPWMKERRRELRRRQTEPERLLWQRLRNRRLGGLKFYRQYSVKSYVLDFYCFRKSLAIEVDGPIHDSPEAWEYDSARTRYLESLGICVLRFRNEAVANDIDSVLRRILDVAEQRRDS